MSRPILRAGIGFIPKAVRIVEVGPRDGLQNEKSVVQTLTKLTLIDKLYATGLTSIEGGAFVSPKWVPQMADSPDIFKELDSRKLTYPNASFSALTPNMQGSFSLCIDCIRDIA